MAGAAAPAVGGRAAVIEAVIEAGVEPRREWEDSVTLRTLEMGCTSALRVPC